MKQILEKIAEYALYAFVFLLPWQTRWIWGEELLNGGLWEYGSYSLYAVDIVWAIVVILALFIGVRQRPLGKQWWIVIGALLLAAVVSVLGSVEKKLSWYALLKLVEGITIVWVLFRLRFRWQKMGIAIVAAGVIQSVLAVTQFFMQEVIANKWLGMAAHAPDVLGDFVVEASTGRFLRAYGSFPHPNMLATFLVVCLIVLVGFLLTMYRDRRPSVLAIIVTVTSFVLTYYGLILTFSRSAWLAFIVVLSAMFIISIWYKDRYRFKILLPVAFWIILVSVFSVILIPEVLETRTFDSGRLEAQSADQRSEYYGEAAELMRQPERWYQGVGIGAYTAAVYQLDGTRESWDYQPVHNLYMLLMVETGLFGGLFFLLLVGHFVYAALINGWRRIQEHTWFFVYSMAVLALLVVGIFEHFLWSLSFGVLFFWLIFGLWLAKILPISDEG